MIDALILGVMAACFVLLVVAVVFGRTEADRSAHGARIPHPRKQDPRTCLGCAQMRHPSQSGARHQLAAALIGPRRSVENGGTK
ncbi:hypothetical protein ACIHEJ_18125 [Streptomyces sp. NPDC052301]|uniref:hypothetical protein n=1 Tax=Streptomyces sp. NPDC052301 TaxID=3365687 RepID=UPI0037CD1B8A